MGCAQARLDEDLDNTKRANRVVPEYKKVLQEIAQIEQAAR